jgi:SAM-dependent methyltransferase
MTSSQKEFLKNIFIINFIFYEIYYPFRLKYKNRVRKIFKKNKNLFHEKSGLEIGGPSPFFSVHGPVPIYRIAGQLDNINFNSKTFWGELESGNNFHFNSRKNNGKQFIADATDLSIISCAKYDFLLNSHVLEHIANPIKAINEWKRVVKKDGYLVFVLPSKTHTFDWKRDLTSLDHMINDFNNNISELDETHFQEIIELHDVNKDSTVSSYEEHVRRTLDNKNTRIVHHHTFNMDLLLDLLKYCDLEIVDSKFILPYNLVVIAKNIQ